MTTIKSILEELLEPIMGVRCKEYEKGCPVCEAYKRADEAVAQIEQLIEEANVTLNEVDVPANIDAYHYAVDILKIHKDNLKKVIR